MIDSVKIRIQMAFWDKDQNTLTDTSVNFVPLLRFVVDSNLIQYPSYTLKAFEPKVDWKTYSCDERLKTNRKVLGSEQISCSKAIPLINNWLSVKNDSIMEQLYTYDTLLTNAERFKIENRVRYYVFNQSDTEDIYNHFDTLTQNMDTCFFHLHLGKLNSEGYIPMRNVIHLDNKNLQADSVFNSTKSTFFEFSRPCPKFCNDVN